MHPQQHYLLSLSENEKKHVLAVNRRGSAVSSFVWSVRYWLAYPEAVAAEPGEGDRGGICHPPTFQSGGNQCKMSHTLFSTWDINWCKNVKS